MFKLYKYMGSLLVLAGSLLIGFRVNSAMVRRGSLLSAMIASLDLMESEIGFRLAPIPEVISALADASDGTVRDFYTLCLEQIHLYGAQDFPHIWRRSLSAALSDITQTGRQVLIDLSDSLGRYGAEDQVAAIIYAKSRLRQQLSLVEAENSKKGRVYLAIAATAGAVAVIVFV